MFTEDDLAILAKKGITKELVSEQINYFKTGFPYLDLVKAASLNAGILDLSNQQVEHYIDHYEQQLRENSIIKFVPASGAASRMFKEFFGLMQDPSAPEQYPDALEALSRVKDFAFYGTLKDAMSADGLDLHQALTKGRHALVLQYILTDKGLDYGFLPKGLLAFHQYGSTSRVAMEEHLVEAAHYGVSGDGIARLHFTVSPQHRQYFDDLESKVKASYEKQFGTVYQITYSEQKPSTDTIAVDLNNHPFRDLDGTILFRPGGHGALLENLNELEADVIFIKNVDNVVPDHLKDETYRYKKALAGLLLQVRDEIFDFLNRLHGDPSDKLISEAAAYLKEQLNVLPSSQGNESLAYVLEKLDRPLRVCGMVKNEGEPGGGPFWVRGGDGTTSMQIVETSQVDAGDSSQQNIVRNATHFNPVDLVCSTRDFRGQKFDLLKFRDPNTGFISQKSKDGKDLKALELPGLWNGAMANWNTIFVEVPAITFNPVKTVNDLLRKEHQP